MLTYGDIPLLVPDRDGVLHRWIEQHFDFEHAEILSDTPEWMLADRAENRDGNVPYVGLPVANYPAAPPPRLNTLWWPTGATRWARGYFLVSEDNLNKILAKLSTPRTLELKTDSESGDVLSLSLWSLSPRKLTFRSDDPLKSAPYSLKGNDDQLYLLPLVDKRYLWQFKSVSTTFTYSTTWESLFESIGSALGESITVDDIDSRFMRPAYEQFNRIRDNAALMLDAAALSIGHRVIHHWPSNSIVVRSADRAQDFLSYNLDAKKEWAQGGYHRLTAKPALVRVTFPRSEDGEVVEGETTSLTYSPTDSSGALPSTEKQFFSTAYEERPGGDFDECSEQYTRLQCLTNAIGESYYDWLEKRFTFAYPGISGWTPFGIENAITWEFSRPNADGITSETRVDSLPDNFGALYQLSQLPTALLTTTTSTTSTTAAPVSNCDGRCKWVWDESTLTWSLDTDGCNTTTTTTAAPTSSTSTSTTDNPCACSTTTPEPTTTTSTTPAPCECLKPTFCGEMDGDCTWTYCSQGTNDEPTCGQSTASTTAAPTTTMDPSCDCGTTTTVAPACSGNCEWVCVPGSTPGLRLWRKMSDGCEGGGCGCDEPEEECVLCATAETPCTAAPTTTTGGPGTPGPCFEEGGCSWVWIDVLGIWALTDWDCPGCHVADPTERCPYPCCQAPSEDGANCGTAYTPCLCVDFDCLVGGDTTTTLDPSTCWQCYTTSSTTTTTTASPCDAFCEWQGYADGSWVIGVNPCPGDCPCSQPAYDAQADCERAVTRCGTGTTSTTTSTSTSTSTTTTVAPSSFCIAPVADDCLTSTNKVCAASVPGGYQVCGAYASSEECGQECVNVTTTTTSTTTAAPTSSTSSTSTTAAAGSWYCYSGNNCVQDSGVGAVSGPYVDMLTCCGNCGGCV